MKPEIKSNLVTGHLPGSTLVVRLATKADLITLLEKKTFAIVTEDIRKGEIVIIEERTEEKKEVIR